MITAGKGKRVGLGSLPNAVMMDAEVRDSHIYNSDNQYL